MWFPRFPKKKFSDLESYYESNITLLIQKSKEDLQKNIICSSALLSLYFSEEYFSKKI
ncbi:hypothetical protein KR50_24100 [Jeotgalibacillus campisalis]|uniref:Uncharacterized protein n=1 Tax=Jeotgalibacillus campisalis TaxID=220754 RepID=A0A0C2VSW9_9BACL|nr:hypothetical protein KR50_24100 [Jeotgalibacillus campisalis]